MGYRRCDTLGTMPEHLPSVEEQLRALDKEKSVGRYTCEERYTPG
jgi:hypothetical protein